MYVWQPGCVLGVMAVLIAYLHLSGETHVRDWQYRSLVSLRAWLACITAAVVLIGVPTWVLSLLWSGFGYLFYTVYLVIPLTMLAFMTPHNVTPLYCRACGRSVKMLASVCHRCGHDHAVATAEQSRPWAE